ncbi:MAG: hypothetical protein EA355_15480 [Rhodobacteraceae bacterium]|nr:MAG: hypothetical protein EA355_15480 [Paracoccaceae bacterium]
MKTEIRVLLTASALGCGVAASVEAAVLDTTGALALRRDGGAVAGFVSGTWESDTLDLVRPYRVGFRLATTSDLVATLDGGAPATLLGPSVLIDETFATPPLALADLVVVDFGGALGLGPLSLGDILGAGYFFLRDNPAGAATVGGVSVSWDVTGVNVGVGESWGDYGFGFEGLDLIDEVIALAGFFGADFGGVGSADIIGLSVDYRLTATLTPVPVPAALPLLATGLGAIALAAARRRAT